MEAPGNAPDDGHVTHLDAFVPRWQFRELHQTRVAASPDKIFEAIRAVRAEDILMFRAVVGLRRGFRRGPESILNPAPDVPILDVATRTGFRYLADDWPVEVVVGMDVARHVFAAMNFLVTPDQGGACILSTETRVVVTDRRAKYTFALYWFVIRAGSGFLRRMWLRAIRHRAERVER